MSQKKIEFSNSILKDRIEILNNSNHKLIFRTFLEPNGGQSQLHYHSKIYETFKIIQGELNIVINNHEKKMITGDEYSIPHHTNHMFFNKSNKEVVFDVEILNCSKMINALQIMYGLVNDGKTNRQGLPKNIFHMAIGLKMMDTFSPKVPHFIQKAGISTLAILGKIIGIEKKLLEKYCA